MKPHTTSNAARMKPAITWNACGATIDGPHCRQGKRPEQREHDRGDRKPAPHPHPRQAEGGRGDDREIDVERPEVRLAGGDQDRGDEGGGDAEPGQRRPVQQCRGQRAHRHQPEQDERGGGHQEAVQRIGRVDGRKGHGRAGGGQDRRDVGDRQSLRSWRCSPCGGSIRRRRAAPARTGRRAARALRGRAGRPRSNSAP